MRFISLFPGLLTSLVLAGCVSASAQQRLFESKPLAYGDASNGGCTVENIVQNIQDEEISHRPGLDPDKISILNWNIYKGQRKDWAADFRRYSDKQDVVTIQEAHLGNDLQSILDNDHRHWAMNNAFYYRDREVGVMTVSTVKPVYSCGQRTLEPLIRLPKTSLISYYPVEGLSQYLLVANIHGINFTFGVGVYKEQIEKLYSAMKNHSGPMVLAGDFNTWSDARMQIVDNLAQRLSLQSLDYTNHNRTSIFGNALDHIFYRGLEPAGQDAWQVTSSDHNPMRVSFRVSRGSSVINQMAVESLHEDDC